MQQAVQQMIEAAAGGALLLTANRRLARFLRDRYDCAQQSAGLAVWETPRIHSFEGWLQQALGELGEDWRLLSGAQLQSLWERLIEDRTAPDNRGLLQLTQTAEQAIAAHQLLNAYRVDVTGFVLTEDQQAFVDWRSAYLRLCREHQWLDLSDLPGHICVALRGGELKVPACVRLIGFDRLPPGAELLCRTLVEQGHDCRPVQVPQPPARQARQYAASDSRDEILAAARWARGLLEQGVQSIGVVVPDLTRRRTDLERIFRDQIDPAATPALHDDEALFSLSLGSPLNEQGVVHAGLEFLALEQHPSLAQISFLLRSPYLGGAERESEARSAADRELRGFAQERFSLDALLRWCQTRKDLPQLRRKLELFAATAGDSSRLSPGAWGECFAEQLQKLGWPGERGLASREFQAVRAWQDKVFAEFGQLDRVLPRITRAQALHLLRRLTRAIDFQPEGPAGPLQVLGLLESSGLYFEHLWVMGLNDTLLPALPHPNPFLPGVLQRRYDMPHASAERELEFAEQVVNRLLVSSSRVVFSYPQWNGDTPLQPSPLLQDCHDLGEPWMADRRDALWRLSVVPSCLESRCDTQGPALQQEYAAGGTGLLKDQAECPFRAFVHYRLQGRALEEPDPGIAPTLRGELVHQVLELIWRNLKSQDRLLALENDRLEPMVRHAVEQCVAQGFNAATLRPPRLLALETERITRLVMEWLEQVEKKRASFQVEITEERCQTRIADLQLTCRADRIDRLTDDSRVIIDYKTGRTQSSRDFFTTPLREPQLPLYAVTAPTPQVAAIAFGRLRRGDCSLIGATQRKDLPGPVGRWEEPGSGHCTEHNSWPELVAFWKDQLDSLARDFMAGEAAVRPYDRTLSCRTCDLAGICRIGEIDLLTGDSS